MMSAMTTSPPSEVAVILRECGPGLKTLRSMINEPSTSPELVMRSRIIITPRTLELIWFFKATGYSLFINYS